MVESVWCPALSGYPCETLYGRKLYLDNKLIGVTQAAEAIHRRLFGGNYEDRDLYIGGLYEQLVSAIPQYLSTEYKDSLISRLKYANEFSLRKRIRELVKACPKEIIREMIGGNRKAVENFIDDLVNLRNSVTHRSDDSEGLSGITSRAYWMIQALKIILEMILFKEIRLSEEHICQLLKRNYRHYP